MERLSNSTHFSPWLLLPPLYLWLSTCHTVVSTIAARLMCLLSDSESDSIWVMSLTNYTNHCHFPDCTSNYYCSAGYFFINSFPCASISMTGWNCSLCLCCLQMNLQGFPMAASDLSSTYTCRVWWHPRLGFFARAGPWMACRGPLHWESGI